MTPAELDEYGLAYFLSLEALNVSVDGRYHRREDFVRIFADRIFYANQRFARKLGGRHSNIAAQLVDTFIAKNAMSTSVDQWSVTLHSFDNARYRAVVKELIESNAICQRSKDAGPQFWEEAFAAVNDDEPLPD
jgi:hypothetical protein